MPGLGAGRHKDKAALPLMKWRLHTDGRACSERGLLGL